MLYSLPIIGPHQLSMQASAACIQGQRDSFRGTQELPQWMHLVAVCHEAYLPSLESPCVNQWILLYSVVVYDIGLFVLPISFLPYIWVTNVKTSN